LVNTYVFCSLLIIFFNNDIFFCYGKNKGVHALNLLITSYTLPFILVVKIALVLFAYDFYVTLASSDFLLIFLDIIGSLIPGEEKKFYPININNTFQKKTTNLASLRRQYNTLPTGGQGLTPKTLNRPDFLEWFRGFVDGEGSFMVIKNTPEAAAAADGGSAWG